MGSTVYPRIQSPWRWPICQILAAFGYLQHAGIIIGISATVTRDNVEVVNSTM